MPGAEQGSVSGAPSSTTWRRQRLLRLGSHTGVPSSELFQSQTLLSPPSESTSLNVDQRTHSYGTLPSPGSVFRKGAAAFKRRAPPNLPNLTLPNRLAISNPPTPTYSPSIFREYSRLGGQRPISAYDQPLDSKDALEDGSDIDARINGVRVWYSSFTSIDWLHDTIKDSVRFSRLRKRKSLRARLRLMFDKSLGWIIVTIVGLLTAIVAFLVVRAEQWLFDLKEGVCRNGWWKAQRFCCPSVDESVLLAPGIEPESVCPAWKPWSEVFHWNGGEGGESAIEHVSYAVVAVSAHNYLLSYTPIHFS
jgi:chloride channel 3/4/5